MRKRTTLLLMAALLLLCATGCTKRCRCIKYNTGVDYFTSEEVSAQGKTCSDMRFVEGLHTQRYSLCEWVYGE